MINLRYQQIKIINKLIRRVIFSWMIIIVLYIVNAYFIFHGKKFKGYALWVKK